MEIFDRIFDRDNVILLLFVDDVDDGGLGGALARAGWSSDEHEAVAEFGDIREVRRKAERFQRRDFGRDDAHHDRVDAALLKDIYAKSRARRQRVTQVGGAGTREFFGRVRMAMYEGQGDDLRLIRRELLHTKRLNRRQLAVDFNLRRLAHREIKVADFVRHQQHSLDYGR